MNSALRIAARVEIDASQAPQAVAQVNQAVASIGTEADRTSSKLQRLINSSVGLSAGPANQNMREWAGALAAQGKSIDDLRAKYNPLFSVIRDYKSSLTEIRTLHAQQVLSTNEMTAAIQRQRQATLASIDAIKGRNVAMHGSGAANQNFAATNLAYQAQDVAVTAAMGMNPLMIGLQQGTQVAGAYSGMSGKEALSTTAAGLASLISPVSIATIGLTAAAAAAIQFGGKMFSAGEDAKKLDEALKNHSDTLDLLRQQYGEVGQAAKNALPVGGSAYTDARARSEMSALQTALRSQSGDLSKSMLGGGFFRGGLLGSSTSGLEELLGTSGSPFQSAIDKLLKSVGEGSGDLQAFDRDLNAVFDTLRAGSAAPSKLYDELERLSAAAQDAFAVKPQYEPFQKEIDRLLLGLKQGNGNLSEFNNNVRMIGASNGMQKVADEIILASKGAIDLFSQLRQIKTIMREIDREDTRPGLADRRDLDRYVAKRDAELRVTNGQFAADQQLAMARTNAERMAAIEAQVRSRASLDGGTGFDQFGNALSNLKMGGGASSGGGLLGWIGGLFGGGVSPLSSSWSANTTFGSFIGAYADGGAIRGPGGPREDNLLIRASAGEFMVNARATAKHRALLEAINSNRPMRAYADGGFINSTAPVYGISNLSPVASANSGRSAITINNFGNDNVTAEETTDQFGNRQTSITVGELSAAAVKQRGNPLRRGLQSEFGLKSRRVAR